MVWFSVRVNTSREWLMAAMVIFSGWAEVLLSFPYAQTQRNWRANLCGVCSRYSM
jgi:hypothetical protein